MLISPILVAYTLNQNEENIRATFVSPSKNADKREREAKREQEVGRELSFCVLNIFTEVKTLPSSVAISLVNVQI